MAVQSNFVREPDGVYNNLNVTVDTENNVTWCSLKNYPKACFTTEMLNELHSTQQNFANDQNQHFYVLLSESSSVFSFGGDLNLFKQCIRDNNRQDLYQYMKQCIDAIYGLTMLTGCEGIALIRGTAFGGGFETALACDTIIAEENATFGFPDRLFNSFPGMGAYHYLVRRVSPIIAQKIITSSRTYTANELLQLGVIDKVVPDGEGYNAVLDHIQYYKRYKNTFNAMRQVFNLANNVDYNQLLQVGELWVNTALNLSEKDLKLMERLARSQESLVGQG